MKKSILSTTFGISALALAGSAMGTPTFTCYDLGPNYVPYAISLNSKYVAGTYESDPVNGGGSPFYLPLTITTGIPSKVTVGNPVLFQGLLAPLLTTSYSMNAWGVNDLGHIVGDCSYTTLLQGSKTHAGFMVAAGSTPSLLSFILADESPAYAVNNNDQVAGYDATNLRGYRWSQQATFYIKSPEPDGSSFVAINDKNYVAGTAKWSTGNWASMYDGTWNPVRMPNTRPDAGIATGISHNDFMCGTEGSGQSARAWRWPDPKYLTYLGVTNQQPSQAWGINDNNYIVGSFGSNLYTLADGTTSTSHAFVNYKGSTLTDLNNPAVTTGIPGGGTLQAATAIANRNSAKCDIVCYGTVQVHGLLGWSSQVHGFLLVQNN